MGGCFFLQFPSKTIGEEKKGRMDLLKHLQNLQTHFDTLLVNLSAPDVAANPQRFQDMRREHARLSPVIEQYKNYTKRLQEEKDLVHLLDGSDAEMKKLAEDDLPAVRQKIQDLEKQLQLSLLPRDPNEDRNILMEIRAGAGGDEAANFAADLLRMYTRYAEKFAWRIEPIEGSTSERGGLKEVIIQISGAGVWKHLKYERGVHRVQRVPATEASGRIHTSTATVAVLPEAEEVDLKIDPADLRIDTFRASGAGGQHINKTDSAVRFTHLPTGLVVACQDERSQIKNRIKAMKLLRSRLLQQMQEKQQEQIAKDRKTQVGSGDRSEKIRTYNFPQDRITDHRINMNVHNLPRVMEGELDDLIKALQADEQSRLMTELSKQLAEKNA